MPHAIPAGFSFGSSSFGLRSGAKNLIQPDFSVLFAEVPCAVAFVSTTNAFCGEPVKLCRKRFASGKKMRGVVINVGIANVGTGAEGHKNAEEMVALSAKKLGVLEEELFCASTGVVGKGLPMDILRKGISENFPSLTKDPTIFSNGIMTTDLVPKMASKELSNGIKIFGTCKGSGMIEPNMATMLAFVTTDASIEEGELQKIWTRVVNKSFNAVSVDGDTSTSDMAFLFASGESSAPLIRGEVGGKILLEEFEDGLLEVCISLAKQIAKDGEGATKLIETHVKNAPTVEDAKKIAKSVINSSLWKCAVFGGDPNWGRLLCAIGYSGANVQPEKVSVSLCHTQMFSKGELCDFDSTLLSEAMKLSNEIRIEIDLHNGSSEFTAWGCDLSYKYVEINAEYHT